MTIGVVQLDAELHLVADSNALGIRILQTSGQGRRNIEIAHQLVALGRLIDDFDIILIHFVLVGDDRPGMFVRIARGIGIVRVRREIVAFDQL